MAKKTATKTVDETPTGLLTRDWVNEKSEELETAICGALPELGEASPRFIWVSPVSDHKFQEFNDAAFMEAVGYGPQARALEVAWPKNGPVWSALADVRSDKLPRPGVLLVTARSHPEELVGDRCKSIANSRKKIYATLDTTWYWVNGIEPPAEDEEEGSVERPERPKAWTEDYYSMASRIAQMYFLRDRLEIPAWHLDLCYVNAEENPATEEDWKAGLAAAQEAMQLSGPVAHTGSVLLSV